MTRGELVKNLIANYGHESGFRAVVERIIEEEKRKQNHVLARSLRKTLSSTLNAKQPNGGRRPLQPLNAEGSKVPEFVERIEPEHVKRDLFLNAENIDALAGLQREFQKAEVLKRHGLPIRSKLLLCGPPGSGKTMCAHVFASELRLPLYHVKIDQIISSYLGETASNIRKVFELAQHQPSVLFLDEFDSLARSRAYDDEHNELRRVVNSLLVFIDRIVPKGFIIAATNFHDALDSAVWRRFDEVVWLEWPDRRQVKKYLDHRLKNFATEFVPRDFACDFEGRSFADIDRVCVGAVKTCLLNGRVVVSRTDFKTALQNDARRRQI